MTKCIKCGKELQTEWKACPFCGELQSINCPHCDKEVSAAWFACPFCGQVLKEDTKKKNKKEVEDFFEFSIDTSSFEDAFDKQIKDLEEKTEIKVIPKEQNKEEPIIKTKVIEKITNFKGKFKNANVKEMGDIANISEITIPYGATSVEKSAFRGCKKLKTLIIPSTILAFEEKAFSNCSNLEEVYYNGTLEDWCKIKFNQLYSNPMFAKNFYLLDEKDKYYKVEDIIVPSSITELGAYTFYTCHSLRTLTIHKNVKSIGRNVFYEVDNLETVYYKGTIEDWNKIKFHNVRANPMYVKNFYLLDENGKYCKLENLTIPSTITSLNDYVFQSCHSLKSVVIPSHVTNFGKEVFGHCKGLKNVTLPNNMKTITDSMFTNCTSLTSITIPSSVTSIGGSAFANCTSLTSITIPSSVTSIGGSAFAYCTSLTNITIPSSVTSIGGSAFADCTNLTSITIPSSVQYVGYYAFSACENITVYCEASSNPSSWDNKWCNYFFSEKKVCVIWGYKR